MIKGWLKGIDRGAPDTRAATTLPDFSLKRLARENPALADWFGWSTNRVPPMPSPLFLHLGCGHRVLDGFVNLDLIPRGDPVHPWNLLDLWPDELEDRADGVFCEDVLEHFFLAEQVYILCNANRVLRRGKIARVLMPSLERLVDYTANYRPDRNEFLHQTYGVETGADALNVGLRFSGHRWLHDQDSIARMAPMCGFEAAPTTCATSTVPEFCGVNLRDETDSLSFANDLRKERLVDRTLLAPQAIRGAEAVEPAAEGVQLYVATDARPTVEYVAAAPIDARNVACINIRSSNLSSFHEHTLKSLVIDDVHCDQPWHFDETMKSRPCMNLVPRHQLPLVAGDATTITRLTFSPAGRAGEYFTLGQAEVFTLD
jgi:predicted SAM-dependent methyltransferase